MLKVLNIEYLGYAGATMGGVAFVVNVDVEKERFPNIQEGMVRLSIVVPIEEDEEIRFSVISRMIDENGEVMHWGEDEKLTKDEVEIIERWCEEQNIRKKGMDIANEYNQQMDLFFKLHEELEKAMNYDGLKGLQTIIETRKVIIDSPEKRKEEALREKIKLVNDRLEELKDMKV